MELNLQVDMEPSVELRWLQPKKEKERYVVRRINTAYKETCLLFEKKKAVMRMFFSFRCASCSACWSRHSIS